MRDYRHILALVDPDDRHHDGVIHRALNLARLGGAQLALLHLIEPDPSLDGGYPPPSHEAARQGFEAGGMRRLAFLAARLEAGEATLLARYGDPASEFAACAGELAPDLVIAAHDPGYLGGRHDLLLLGTATAKIRGRGRVPTWLASLAGMSHA